MRLCITSVLGLWLVGTAALAQPEDRAKELFRQGKEFYGQGQYEQAIGTFKEAGKIRPSPLLDYNIGRCHEKLDDKVEAVASYERYLKGMPDAPNRELVERRIADLKRAIAAGSEASPGSETPPREEPSESAPPASQPSATVPVSPPGSAEEPGMPGGADPVHEASLRPGTSASGQKARPAPRPGKRPRPYRAPGGPEEGPIYKQWWFWVGCAGAAVIVGFVIATAVSSPDSGDPPSSAGGLRISF